MENYSLAELQNTFVTQGLSNLMGKEFSISKGEYSPKDVELIINYILDYVTTENRLINNLQTLGLGSWMIQFVFSEKYIELHELKEVFHGKNKYAFDLTLTIKFLKEQLELCQVYNVSPHIPLIGQKVAVSKDIYDGSEINGVRYKSPAHMTGWYLTSNSYNGDINSLLIDHLFHLLKARPDIARFLALGVGYRFYCDKEAEQVWIDEEVVNSK